MLQGPVETSACSRSHENLASSGSRSKIILGKFSWIDALFPLFDHIIQQGIFPAVIPTVFCVFSSMQIMFCGLWPQVDFWLNTKSSVVESFATVSKVFWFISTKFQFGPIDAPGNDTPSGVNNNNISLNNNRLNFAEENNYLLTMMIVILVVFVLTACSLISHQVYSLISHRYLKWLLYVNRFMFEYVIQVMIHPTAAFTGASLLFLMRAKGSEYWGFLIIGAIMLIYFVIIFCIMTRLSTHSTILSASLSTAYDCGPITTTFIVDSVFIILGYVFQYFPKWLTAVLQIVYLVGKVFNLINVAMFMPFHTIAGNTLFMSTLLTNCLMTFCLLIGYLISSAQDNALIFLILWPIFFVLSLIGFGIKNKLHVKKIKQRMNNQRGEFEIQQMSEEDIFMAFESYGLNKSEKKCLTYERVGFSEICDYFIDWSIVRFISTTFQSNSTICYQVQMLSYFPSESRQLNSLFNICSTKNDLKIDERFLLYQVYRLKSMRQSSASNEANDKLTHLRNSSEEVLSNVLGFWRFQNPDVSYFESLSAGMQRLDSLWMEAIRDYPNSSKFCEEYSKFLTECRTDFQKAIIIKERADLIELGKTFTIDRTFRTMVRSFPDYIKKRVLDGKGSFKHSSNSDKSDDHSSTTASTSDSLSSDLSLSNDNEMDAELEGKLASTMFTYSKLRMALYHALKGRKHGSISSIPFAVVISLVVSIACFVGFYFYVQIQYKERADSMHLLTSLTFARLYNGLAVSSLTLNALKKNNMIEVDFNFSNEDSGGSYQSFIDLKKDLARTALTQSYESNDNFGRLLQQVADMSLSGVNVYEVASVLLTSEINFTVCWDGVSIPSDEQNLKNLYSYIYFQHQRVAAIDSVGFDLFTTNQFCELLQDNRWSSIGSQDLANSITEFQINKVDTLESSTLVIMIAIPICILLVSFCPIMGLSLWFVYHCDEIAEALSEMQRETKEKAIFPIRKNENEEFTINEPKLGITKMVFYNISIFILSVFIAILFLLMLFTANNGLSDILQISMWEHLASMRLVYSVEAMEDAILVIVLNKPNMANYTDRDIEIANVRKTFDLLENANNLLIRGTDRSKPCGGYDGELDSLNTLEQCKVSEETETFHDTYRCGSTSHLLSAFNDIVTNIIANPSESNGELKGEYPMNMLHIVDSHLLALLTDFVNRCAQLVTVRFTNLMFSSMILMVVGIVLSLVLLVFGLIIQNYATNTYFAALAELKRVPPIQMIQNKKIKDLLLNRKEENKNNGSSFARSILHKSGDAMLCTSINGIIEIVNPYVTKTFGFSPDQLLGQPVSVLFKDDSIVNQMTMMKEGQSSSLYENQMICVSDNGMDVPVHTTVLGMKRDGSTAVESFVLILRDDSELVAQQKRAEDAKSQSENLLFQILPRDIVVKLNRGEKDISFTVSSASIIFIDIVQFSAYTASLTPQEIMGNLSLIFAAFDRLIKKYPLITKIKLIGDIYMAASGLFATEDVTVEHASQTVKFGLDSIQELEDINVKLNASLQVRVGVNTGGPLIAGVLGTDKPVFDIIGDPINVASRLQSTDVPGKVQISQYTNDCLNSAEYTIEPRGEVFLKGKGKVNTFLVSSGLPFASFEMIKNSET